MQVLSVLSSFALGYNKEKKKKEEDKARLLV